ncbi:unnamed protein product [Sphenostylis stenocarpa]|uniref:Auxin-induced protein n=1 Tax=Sphenostylis stenocarpa TaxID=92480 RepID=A0AA86SMN6_9FABA|nr:unnamed protein product [Sphenostylis stenocarpa]
MELQLGLTLSNNSSKVFDLNSRARDSIIPFKQNSSVSHKKRTFSQLHKDEILPTLSLLPSTPDHHENDPHHHIQCSNIIKNNEEDVVGWPPVNYWRKKLCVDGCGDNNEVVGNNDHMVWADHCNDHGASVIRGSNSLYVKVKMEGVGIARKVDLCMHQSFHTLMKTLMDMFGKCNQESNCYELAYQDNEGDWLLAQDVPWRNFIGCAQRLRLLKTST